jgi:SARP family transcriptional regulator, regulator of embCAB operon
LAGRTRIELCGHVVVEVDGRRVDGDLPGRQGRVLFAYLAVNRLRAVPRDELVEAVWPADAPEAAESALSALLSKLRRALGGERLEGRRALRLRLPHDAWIDVEAAAEALHRAQSASAAADWTAAWGPARVVQHVAVRPFLPGEDAPWVAERRRKLDEMYVRSLELVAEAGLGIGGGELDTAERAARALVERAPYRESGYRFAMRALTARENHAEALRVYETLRTRLREELGVAPAAATQAVYRDILART